MKQDNRKKGKILLALATTGAITLSMLAASVESFANPKASGFIGDKKAKEIALTHAKLKAKDVTFVKTGIDYENGTYEYDVKFYKGNKEYDYDIDAKTGKILDFDTEIENFVIPGTQNDKGKKPAVEQANKNSTISLEQAKAIALKHVGLTAKQVKFGKAKLDRDDRILNYEIEFFFGNGEYEFEIDAKTGKILSYDFEMKRVKKVNQTKPVLVEEDDRYDDDRFDDDRFDDRDEDDDRFDDDRDDFEDDDNEWDD